MRRYYSHDIVVMEYISDRIAVVHLGRVMEIGPTAAICSNPKHPHTEALLSAVPDPNPTRKKYRLAATQAASSGGRLGNVLEWHRRAGTARW